MGMHEEAVIDRICEIYGEISKLKSLKPSKDVNLLFTELVSTCIPPCSIDVNTLSMKAQAIRSKLIKLCGEAEGYLESHFSDILAAYEKPLDHLDIFPYYNNYLKLSFLEFNILCQHVAEVPSSIAFVGSGPLPLTTIVLALNHMTNTEFHNYDIDPSANSKAKRLIVQHPDLSKRMFFHNRDVMDMGDDDQHVNKQLKDYDVVFLAALVGMDNQEKVKIVTYLSKHMAPGSILMLRSAHGSRAFLYPVVEPSDLHGFEVLSVYHPTDEVINSIIIARRSPFLANPDSNGNSIEFEQLPLDGGGGGGGVGIGGGMMMLQQKYHTSKCAEIECFHPLAHVVHGHGVGGMMMMEEVGINEDMMPS